MQRVEVGNRTSFRVETQIVRVEYRLERHHEEHKVHRVEHHVQQFGKFLPFVTEHPIDQDSCKKLSLKLEN